MTATPGSITARTNAQPGPDIFRVEALHYCERTPRGLPRSRLFPGNRLQDWGLP